MSGGRLAQRGVCVICERPIAQGEGVRWVALPGYGHSRLGHSSCVERDWEAIEAGLESFPRVPPSPTTPNPSGSTVSYRLRGA